MESSSPIDGKYVYLSGPMTGYDDYQKPLFDEVEKWCYENGARYVYNPCSIIGHYETREQYMTYDLCRLVNPPATIAQEMLINLPHWMSSEGSTIENIVAYAIGMERWEVFHDNGGYALARL